MAITTITYKILRDMKNAGILPQRPHVLELGESNWYGDVGIEQLEKDINTFVKDGDSRKALLTVCESCRQKLSAKPPRYEALWDLSQIFYQVFLQYEHYEAIDLGGSEKALKLDLNNPIGLDRRYDIVIDFGTAEHVFNVYQLFKTVHEVTKPGGFILHGLPFQGWVDHGFYNFQPTFYLDLAATNNYQVRLLIYWNEKQKKAVSLQSREQIAQLFKSDRIDGSGMLFAMFQTSGSAAAFKTPIQGYYAGAVSDSVHAAWHNNR